DVPPMYDKGINVAIGTDSVASNNSLNFFEEMKLFALTGKITSMDPASMTPQQVLRSATRAGALSQGREDCGLVKEGYKADLIVVDISGPNWAACDDIANGLIYSADGKDVCLTMCDGMTLYRDGEYTFIDIEKTIAEAENARQEILRKL
ncbi:MAG: amidohydrolase family protein, partial [Mogibacterium sp.]|nr:amidohydrolase family protein [Mogibacterium sp.]